MDLTSAAHRNRVLRAFFEGKDWDRNEEFMLKRKLVLGSAALLPAYPLLVDDEWEVEPGHTNLGRGDLVFTDGQGGFAVVEVKFIDVGRKGATVRRKRTASRGQVIEQAATYAAEVARRYSCTQPVRAFAYTNEEGLVQVDLTPART